MKARVDQVSTGLDRKGNRSRRPGTGNDFAGPGADRHPDGADYDSFVGSAELGFFALYTAALFLAAGIGRALASWQLGAMTLAATALFMLLSFPAVEFVNECNVGEPVLLSAGRC